MSDSSKRRRTNRRIVTRLRYDSLEVRALLAGAFEISPQIESFALTQQNANAISLNTRYEIPTQSNQLYNLSFNYRWSGNTDNLPVQGATAPAITVSWNARVVLTVTPKNEVSTASLQVLGALGTSELRFTTQQKQSDTVTEPDLGMLKIFDVRITKSSLIASVGGFLPVNSNSISDNYDLETRQSANPVQISGTIKQEMNRETPEASANEEPLSLVALRDQSRKIQSIRNVMTVNVERDRFFQLVAENKTLDSNALRKTSFNDAVVGRFQKISLIDENLEASVTTLLDSVGSEAIVVVGIGNLEVTGQLAMPALQQTKLELGNGKPESDFGEDGNEFVVSKPVIGSVEDLVHFNQSSDYSQSTNSPLDQTFRLVGNVSKQTVLISLRETEEEFESGEARLERDEDYDAQLESRRWAVVMTSIASLFVGGVWRKRKRDEQIRISVGSINRIDLP